jgi:hypothetical protein
MGADEYYWTRTVTTTKVANGIQISWECLNGATSYKVDYAGALSAGMTWSTFPETISGSGLERASYVDTGAGSQRMRFYRVRKFQ